MNTLFCDDIITCHHDGVMDNRHNQRQQTQENKAWLLSRGYFLSLSESDRESRKAFLLLLLVLLNSYYSYNSYIIMSFRCATVFSNTPTRLLQAHSKSCPHFPQMESPLLLLLPCFHQLSTSLERSELKQDPLVTLVAVCCLCVAIKTPLSSRPPFWPRVTATYSRSRCLNRIENLSVRCVENRNWHFRMKFNLGGIFVFHL